MKKRDLTEVALIAALYAILTWFLAPISFGPLQFRVAELLKPLALRGRKYIVGLTLGLILANLFSPNAGIWELAVMPMACFLGGVVAWHLRRYPFLALALYCAWVSLAVSVMLAVVLNLPFLAVLPGIATSEAVLFFLGWGLSETLFRRANKGRSSSA